MRERLQGLTAKLGRNHVQTLAAMNNLASADLRAGNPVAAEPLLREELVLRNAETHDRLATFEVLRTARRQLAQPEQIRRGRAALAGGLQRDERT